MTSINQQMIERRKNLLGAAYGLFYQDPIHLVRGEGVWLFDAQGRKYLDMYNNVAHVGHCHPHVVEALSKQIATLNTHTRYLHDNVLDYAERLTGKFPGELDTAMFTCTGSESNELALRIARTCTGGTGIIVTDYAYHGNTKAIFEITTSDPQAQKFFNQGIGQLHGFWNFEAERSFRQVAALDPKCAMAYWGMAMANRGNSTRGKGFIDKAVKAAKQALPKWQKIGAHARAKYLYAIARQIQKHIVSAIRQLKKAANAIIVKKSHKSARNSILLTSKGANHAHLTHKRNAFPKNKPKKVSSATAAPINRKNAVILT